MTRVTYGKLRPRLWRSRAHILGEAAMTPCATTRLIHAFKDFRVWAAANEGMNSAQLNAPVYLFPQHVAMGKTGATAKQPHPFYWLCYTIGQKEVVKFVMVLSGGRMLVSAWLHDEEGWGLADLRGDAKTIHLRNRWTNNCIVQLNLCGCSATSADGLFVVGQRLIANIDAVTAAMTDALLDGRHRRLAFRAK